MLWRRLHLSVRLALTLIAALAMTSTAFAHRVSQPYESPALLAYLSMGGTLTELCGDADPAHRVAPACEACIVSATALLPRQIPVTGLRPDAVTEVIFASDQQVARQLIKRSHPARGPPSSDPN